MLKSNKISMLILSILILSPMIVKGNNNDEIAGMAAVWATLAGSGVLMGAASPLVVPCSFLIYGPRGPVEYFYAPLFFVNLFCGNTGDFINPDKPFISALNTTYTVTFAVGTIGSLLAMKRIGRFIKKNYKKFDWN